jgi:hypothetical protein
MREDEMCNLLGLGSVFEKAHVSDVDEGGEQE